MYPLIYVEMAGAWNATTNSGVAASSVSIVPAIVLTIGTIFAVLIAFYSVEYLAKVIRAVTKIAYSIKYALYGGAITTLLWVLYALFQMLLTSTSGVNPAYIGYGIGGYIVLYIIGRVGEIVAMRILKTVTSYRELHENVSSPSANDPSVQYRG